MAIAKKKKRQSFNTHITDNDDLEEISKITEMLNPDEKVLLVTRQSRINLEVLYIHQTSSILLTEELS